MPTYDEMLEMDEEKCGEWILLRTEKPNREKLIEEMIDHEERTKSFEKTMAGKEITGEQRMVLDIFDRMKSLSTIQLLSKLEETLEGEEKDIVQEAIFAKTASDLVHLGANKMFWDIVNEA